MDVEDIQYIVVNTPLEIVKKLLPILYDLLYIATILYKNKRKRFKSCINAFILP